MKELKKIREWLRDWNMVSSSEETQRSSGMFDLLNAEVDSEEEALRLINLRIDNLITLQFKHTRDIGLFQKNPSFVDSSWK